MFTPERLVLARRRRRMTLSMLSTASDVSPQSLTAYENGRKNPSEETLSSLAKALHFPASFFAAPPAPEMPVGAVSFRAPTRMSAAERESALSSGSIAADFNLWLEDRFRLPKANVPACPDLTPEEAASHVRAFWGLGEATAPHMVHLLEANGVRVFSLPRDCRDIDAFSIMRSGTPYVFLNTSKTGERGRFDVAHELGHLVLHSEHRTPCGRASEPEANAFASEFLMPRAGVLAQQLHNASVERILSAKRKWGVSAMALAYRLRTLGLLSDWRFHQAVKHLASMGYRKDEPGSTLVRESSKLLAKVFEVLRDRGDTVADISAAVNIYPDDLNEYVFGLVPISLAGGGERSAPKRPALTVLRGR